MGPQGLLVLGLPAPFVPHPASLSPATAMRVLSTPVPVSAPPTSLYVFIFYFLGVGPPCCSILCQFWLCEEAQCVYLRRHLGSPRFDFFNKCQVKHITYFTAVNGFHSFLTFAYSRGQVFLFLCKRNFVLVFHV